MTPATAALMDALSAIEATSALDLVKSADLHHRTVQDIRRQLRTEYNAAVAAEIAAAADLLCKRRRADEIDDRRKGFFYVRNPPETPRGFH